MTSPNLTVILFFVFKSFFPLKKGILFFNPNSFVESEFYSFFSFFRRIHILEKKSLSLELFLETVRQEAEQFGFLNEDETIVSVDEATIPEFVSHIKDVVDVFLKEQLIDGPLDSSEDAFEDEEFLLMDDDDEDDEDSTIY